MLLGINYHLLTYDTVAGTGLMCTFPARCSLRYAEYPVDINNVGSIVQALLAAGNPSWNPADGIEKQAAQVSIISVANSAGRLLIGE